jgi:hypothetical protein
MNETNKLAEIDRVLEALAEFLAVAPRPSLYQYPIDVIGPTPVMTTRFNVSRGIWAAGALFTARGKKEYFPVNKDYQIRDLFPECELRQNRREP